MRYLWDGEWFRKPEADRRMMYRALERISANGVTRSRALEIVSDTLGFVGELEMSDCGDSADRLAEAAERQHLIEMDETATRHEREQPNCALCLALADYRKCRGE